MNNNKNALLRRKKLVIAMSLALAGATLTGCSTDEDDDTPTSGNIINGNGGLGSISSQGGDGGEFYIEYDEGTAGVELKKEGKASTSFTRPALPTSASLGDNPLLISTDTTIDDAVTRYNAVTDGTGTLSIGQVYMGTDSVLRTSVAGGFAAYATDTLITDSRYYHSNLLSGLLQAIGDDATADPAPAGMLYVTPDSYSDIYLSDGDTAIADVSYTGLSIAADSSLTLGDNSGCTARIRFDNDIENKGTITKADNNCGLHLSSSNYFGTGNLINAGTADDEDAGSITISANFGINNSGAINTSGFDVVDNDGGSGGNINLNADAYILNTGSMDSTGGDGFGDGGDGGYISFSSPVYLENAGTLNSNGGNNTDPIEALGNGGDGGGIYLGAEIVLNNSASSELSSNGGDGDTGGYSGDIELEQDNDLGAILNAGNISTNGGNGNTNNGGDGGELYLNTEGALIHSSGELSSTGGNSTDSNGGDGGEVHFFVDYAGEDSGEIVISGNIDVSGGNSTSNDGGDGGEVIIWNDGNNNSDYEQRIALLGYSSLEFNGGDAGEGGHGGGYNDDGIEIRAYDDAPIVNELAINAKGGNSTDEDEAGNGGDIYFYANGDITNSGAINTNSGEDGYDAGSGGEIDMYSDEGTVTNNAALSANSTDAISYGSDGGNIDLHSDSGPVINTSTLSANGSSAENYGGNGGYIEMYGVSLSNSSALRVKGGNATATTVEGNEEEVEAYGGDGGYINLTTQLFTPPTNSGSFTYSAGTGETVNGTEGCAITNFTSQGNCGDFEFGGDGGEFFFK